MSDETAKLDADGLPENAVDVVAQALCCGTTKGCSGLIGGGPCIADDVFGTWALQAVSGLRGRIRRARRQSTVTS